MTALNFPDSPSNGDTHTAGGKTFTYDSTVGAWSPAPAGATTFIGLTDTPSSFGTASQIPAINSGANALEFIALPSSVTVYATVDLLPLSGNSAGDQALVTATNRLYIWNGSGWYNIALINTNPSISGASSSYALATDGTATTVTITATDPEGLPITYSIASDTSGNIATVAQGTGANTNVFTVTPSTNSANAGIFSLTFRASDGVNIATAVSEFTLQFSVQNQQYTTALITSVGANDAVNNSFDDKSTNDYAITTAGNAHQTTFSPYRHGGYSTYFDGSGDYLQPAGTTIFDISSSTASFTVEAWINPPVLPSAGAFNYRFGSIISKGTVYVSFGFTNNGTLRFYTYSGAENYINSAAGVIEAGKWQHVAVVSDSGSITLYKDGVSVATGTLVAPQAPGTGIAPKIATADTGQAADYINSYVTDLRVVDGTAVYTSAFTPPTERLTAITNTSLLACHLPYIADGSTTGHSITVYGNTKTTPFAPYDEQEYSAADHLGSAYFDGTGDSLNFTTTGDLQAMGRSGSACTVEAWVYLYSVSSNGTGILAQGTAGSASGSNIYEFGIKSDRRVRAVINGGYSNESGCPISAGTVPFKAWTHLAWVLHNQTWTIYINGKADGTATGSYPSGTTHNAAWIGRNHYDAARTGEANIADLRVNATEALYTSNFTPPTAPVSTTSNTVLHMPMTDAGIIDKAQSEEKLILTNGAKSSITQTKYLTSSMYFDGDAYIKCDAGSQLYGYTGPFTIEAWIYPTSLSAYGNPIFNYGNSGATGNDHFNFELCGTADSTNSGKLHVRWDSAYPVRATAASATPLNTWTHVAFTRDSSNNIKLWINGTENASGTKSGAMATASQANRTVIGSQTYSEGTATRSYTGYISDLRVTKGLARYTSAFTAPAAALKG